MKRLDEGSNGGEITVKRDEIIAIELPERGTGGYRWSLESSGEPVCAPLDDERESRTRPGGEGTHEWRFKAERSGTGTIALLYRRGWETDGDALRKEFRVTIHVAD